MAVAATGCPARILNRPGFGGVLHETRGDSFTARAALLGCCVSFYEAVTGPAAVFHLKVVPDVPPISPATQNWLVVPGCGAAAK